MSRIGKRVAVRRVARLARRLALGGPLAAAAAIWMLASAPAVAAADTGDGSRTSLFHPVGDARVEEMNPGTNFGGLKRLGSDGDPGQRIASFLRFDVAGLAGQVDEARLRLYVVSDGTLDGPAVRRTGNGWSETEVTWNNRPTATGGAVAKIANVAAGTWVDLDVTPLVTGEGTLSLTLDQTGLDGVVFYSREGPYPPQLQVVSSDPTVLAAGDIACAPGSPVTATTCRHAAVSDLLLQPPQPTRVLALGDEQYEDGALADFLAPSAYDATWGRVRSITRPVPGNHEYHVAGASDYFDYFNGVGAASGPAGERGKGYYSYDLGTWHLIALNSEISTTAGSEQGRWLQQDLTTTSQPCVLAYWHEPRFTSGTHGPALWVAPLWTALRSADADIVLNGHDHDYERFAQQDANGDPDPQGIRQFVVGTGGEDHYAAVSSAANSEVFDGATFGVLKLTLRRGAYDWQFVPEGGAPFTDEGTTRCNDDAPKASLAVTPATGVAPLAATADASASTDGDRTPIAGYEFDFGDGSPLVGPQPDAVATHSYARPGTYTVTTTVSDTAGQSRKATAEVVVRGNLIGNSGFEADTAGWNAPGIGQGIVLDRVMTSRTGEMAARVANRGPVPETCALNDSPNWAASTSAGLYTATLWARAEGTASTFKLRLAEWQGDTLVGSARTAVTLTADWQPVTVNYRPAAPNLSTLDLNGYVVNAPPGTCFLVDDASLALTPD